MSRHSILTAAGLCLLLAAAPLWAQQRDVSGRVTSASTGEPLAGASVVVVGTGIGTLTDENGAFRVRVPAGEVTLLVRSIGYVSREVSLAAGQTSVLVALASDVLRLEEVVVTGAATTVARRNLANAVATVSAAELKRAPAETVEKMLQGKVAGANIETNSGAPGGGVQVRLRGVSTINADSDPLYVVDGVIVSNVAIASNQNAVTRSTGGSNPSLTQDALVNRIADLNPEDIETVEILKGASAAAIYGAKASNGVVIITTKRGSPGRPRINVSQRVGVFDLSNKLGFRRFETVEEAVATWGEGARQHFRPGQVFDHEELLAGRNDLSTETAVSISGGNENTRYYVSGLWKDDEGIIANTGAEQQSLRVNLDQRVGSRLDLSFRTNVVHTLAERGLTNNDNAGVSFYMAFPATPSFVDLRPRPDGTFPANPFIESNPLQTAALMKNEEEVWRFIGSAGFTLEAYRRGAHSLRILGHGGLDYFTQENDLFFPPDLQFEPNDDGKPGTSLLGTHTNLNLNATLNAVHAYTASSGTWTTSAGVQLDDRDLNIARIDGRNMIGGKEVLSAAAEIVAVGEQHRRVKDVGLYLQEEALLLDDRVLLTAGIRADRSSANGEVDRFFYYPKAAASYRIPNALPNVNDLKLRVAWGQSGNKPLFGMKFLSLTTNNIEGQPGLLLNPTAGDPSIKPERQTEIEGGFDATLFDGNASFELTVYQRSITDLLLQRTTAPSTGFTSQFFNGGELRTRGIEIALAATPFRRGDLTWISRTTFFRDYSEIVELPVPSFRTGGFATSLGAFQIQEGASATQIVTNLGRDAEGNLIVGKVGDANPDFRMGFVNEFRWRDFSLYSLFDWAQGQTVVNLTTFLYDLFGNSVDYALDPREETIGGITVEGTRGERRVGRWVQGDSRAYMEDGSYLKLRELSLSYDVPQQVVGAWFGGAVRSARLTFSGRNLLTVTDYTGLDPEVSNFGNQPIARNIDVAPFPPSRSFWFSLDVGF